MTALSPPPDMAIAQLFPPPKHDPPHRYKGHRRNSFIEQDIDELVELRARQRTFDGAYMRTALGNFGYALLILKIFTKEFARIGLLYVILAVLLLLISYRRSRRSDHDFADIYRPLASPPGTTPSTTGPSSLSLHPAPRSHSHSSPPPACPAAPPPLLPANQRHWGRPFRTSGDVVVLVGIVVTVLYAAIFGMIMKL